MDPRIDVSGQNSLSLADVVFIMGASVRPFGYLKTTRMIENLV